MDAAQSLAASPPSEAQVWDWLSALTDPEIPVVTLREMGILRGVEVHRDHIQVTITPTYSGCPAMSQIEDDIVDQLARHGQQARVITQLAPAWSTDWMDAVTHRKLREYGIAPPRAQPLYKEALPCGSRACVRHRAWLVRGVVLTTRPRLPISAPPPAKRCTNA